MVYCCKALTMGSCVEAILLVVEKWDDNGRRRSLDVVSRDGILEMVRDSSDIARVKNKKTESSDVISIPGIGNAATAPRPVNLRGVRPRRNPG